MDTQEIKQQQLSSLHDTPHVATINSYHAHHVSSTLLGQTGSTSGITDRQELMDPESSFDTDIQNGRDDFLEQGSDT
jgi:hypothetical protein